MDHPQLCPKQPENLASVLLISLESLSGLIHSHHVPSLRSRAIQLDITIFFFRVQFSNIGIRCNYFSIKLQVVLI